jgi:hypothetical protein
MSDYANTYDGATKDSTEAIIYAADIDTQLDAVSTAIATKVNKYASPSAGNILMMTGGGDIDDTTYSITEYRDYVLEAAYPVGSIYMATVATNPGTLLGVGTWTALGEGRVLVGVGAGAGLTSRALDDTGGSEDSVVVDHTHTATQSAHTHTVNGQTNDGSGPAFDMGTGTGVAIQTTSSATPAITVDATTDSDGIGTNMPPFLAVHMWERTA